jgi:signal transduction histidine kinase
LRAEFGAFFHNIVDEKGEFRMNCTVSGVSKEAFSGFPMPRNTLIIGRTFRGKEIVRFDDVTEDSLFGQNPPYVGFPEGHPPVRSYLAAPVVTRSGEVLGGLFFGHSLPGRFTETHESIITGISAQAAISMDNALLFEQAQQVQTELKRYNEILRRANNDLEVFAYSASHDLQEPLRSIALSGQLLERNLGGQLTGEDALLLSNMTSAARRMSTLIDDLLAYVRSAEQDDGEPLNADAGEVLARVLGDMQGLIRQTEAVITSEPLPIVRAHAPHLARVFQNLISNAIKYRTEESPHVAVTAAQREGWCVISVTDNGIGIKPEYADRIFDLFKRLHGRDQYPGSGIGLAICRRVVEQYGGRIWLEHSDTGRGSTFSFSLPLAS